MERSRLGQILEAERRSGKGTLGALVSALGGRTLEALDPRGRFLGRAGTRSNTFAQSLGRSVFGAGYSATRGSRYPAERIYSDSAGLGGGASAAILSSMDSRLASIDAKMSLVAKAGIAQNRVARDINVMRQNIQVQTKSMTGSSRTKADMYFMNAKQRESEYERQFGKETKPTESATPETTPKSSLIGMLGKGMGMLGTGLKAGAGIGAIYLGIQALSGIVKAFSFFSSLAEPIIKKVMDFVDVAKSWKEKWNNFNLNEYLKSISPEQLGTMIDSITNFLKNTSNGIGDTLKGLIEKLPAEKTANLISAVVDSFLATFKAVAGVVTNAVSTMSSDNILKLAAAGGLYALLFGGAGSKLVGGLIGSLLSGAISTLSTGISAFLIPALGPAGVIGLAIAGLVAAIAGVVWLTTRDVEGTPKSRFGTTNETGRGSSTRAKNKSNDLKEIVTKNVSTGRGVIEAKKIERYKQSAANAVPGKAQVQPKVGGGFIPSQARFKIKDNPIAKLIYDKFKAAGFTHEQSIAAVANAQAESSFNPTAKGDGDNSIGLFQFNFKAGRGVDFLGETIDVNGKPFKISSDPEEAKLQFMDPEVNIAAMITAAKKEGYGKNPNMSLEDANKFFVSKLERPADTSGETTKRFAYAQAIADGKLLPNQSNLSQKVANVLSDAASTAADSAREGLQIVQNFYASMEKKAEEAENALLSSFDSNTIKDIINPLLMRTTMSYL